MWAGETKPGTNEKKKKSIQLPKMKSRLTSAIGTEIDFTVLMIMIILVLISVIELCGLES